VPDKTVSDQERVYSYIFIFNKDIHVSAKNYNNHSLGNFLKPLQQERQVAQHDNNPLTEGL